MFWKRSVPVKIIGQDQHLFTILESRTESLPLPTNELTQHLFTILKSRTESLPLPTNELTVERVLIRLDSANQSANEANQELAVIPKSSNKLTLLLFY